MAERVSSRARTGPAARGHSSTCPRARCGAGASSPTGFTLGKDCPAAARICKQLAAEGIGMLRFDNLGLGDSEGDWGDGSFTHKVADTVAGGPASWPSAARPVDLLVGHSFGGAAVLAAAGQIRAVRAVVSIGAPVEPSHAEHHYDALVDRVLAEGQARVAGGRPGADAEAGLRRGRPRRRPARAASASSACRCW